MSGLARAIALVVATSAAWVAYRAGGGADPRREPPRVTNGDERAARGGARAGADGYQVALRLLDKMGEARVDGPGTAARGALASYWRKMPLPWAPLSDAAKWTTSIALRTGVIEPAPAKGDADARAQGVPEGTFEQRGAIAVATPSTVTFHLVVPAMARLDFSTALLGGKGETEFGVSVVDAQGRSHDVFSRATPSRDAKEWLEASIDLSPWSGEAVDLRLRAVPKLMVALQAGMSAVEATTSAVALWGNPRILARGPTSLPYNVLWVTVDALRPDAVASFHDDVEDEQRQRAHRPPLDALLPKLADLTPSIDALAARGVRFTHAYASATWTRPGTLALLSGARSTELGVDPLAWVVPPDRAAAFYASQPPLLPLLLRRAGVETLALVDNYFMSGYAAAGLDLGFDRVDDFRYRTRDTLEITRHATQWIRAHEQERFFLYCHLASPHEPWEPPERLRDRVAKAPGAPADPATRAYLAEVAKDDEAVGALLQALDDVHLRERTLVVLAADHGETLSREHPGFDKGQARPRYATGNYEETVRVPILLALPGVLPEGREIKARVRTIDVAPTVLELLGADASPKASGASLVPLARGEREADERVVLTEGRGSRGLLAGKWHFVAREGAAPDDKSTLPAEELFDLEDDPGERRDVAREHPDVVGEMRARLEAAKKNTPVAGTRAALAIASKPDERTFVHLRFAGGGRARRVAGTVSLVDPKARFVVAAAVGAAAPESVRADGGRLEIALTTAPDAPVGVDLATEPPGAALEWSIFLDDVPLAPTEVFAGPFGFAAPALQKGLLTDHGRAVAYSPVVPEIDPRRDVGLFVARERPGEAPSSAPSREVTNEASDELTRILRERGYAPPGPPAKPKHK